MNQTVQQAAEQYVKDCDPAEILSLEEGKIVTDAFVSGWEEGQPQWIPVTERLPELQDGKSKKMLIRDKKGHLHLGYYFPDKFKTVEWEDWDDYSQEDFPYTTEDQEKGVVWLNAGFYETEDECNRCGGWWSSPIPTISWCQIPDSLLNFKP